MSTAEIPHEPKECGMVGSSFSQKKYNNEAAGLRGGGAGNLISPAPGMPKSLFNIFCFYSSKPPRGRIAHTHLNALH